MQKNLTMFKSVINGVESFFHFEAGASTTTAKEAIFDCLKWIGQIEDQMKATAEAQAKEKSADAAPEVLPDATETPAPKA